MIASLFLLVRGCSTGAVEGRATVLSTAIEATLTAYAYNQTNGDFL